jgi:hypothetical protein
MRREEERQLKRKAFQEDMERRRKAEEARKETEAILAAQVWGWVAVKYQQPGWVRPCMARPAAVV